MFHDPIVEEVRAIREQLAAQFNFDIRKIVEDAQRRQATSGFRIVSFVEPNPDTAGQAVCETSTDTVTESGGSDANCFAP